MVDLHALVVILSAECGIIFLAFGFLTHIFVRRHRQGMESTPDVFSREFTPAEIDARVRQLETQFAQEQSAPR